MPLSFSQLHLYQTCPRQFEFAHIKKIPRSISAGESFGSSVHNAFARFGKEEIENGRLKMEDDQLALFSEPDATLNSQLSTLNLTELWHQSFITQGYKTKEDVDRARKKGEVLMQHFFDWWSTEEREVLAIEKGFRLEEAKEAKEDKEAKDVIITGRFDRVEKSEDGVRVIDYKTGSIRSQKDVDEDLQLSIYAIAAEQVFDLQCTDLVLLFLHEDGITEVRTMRSQQQLAEAQEIIRFASEGIEAAQFDPQPSETKCARCPYKGICDAALVVDKG